MDISISRFPAESQRPSSVIVRLLPPVCVRPPHVLDHQSAQSICSSFLRFGSLPPARTASNCSASSGLSTDDTSCSRVQPTASSLIWWSSPTVSFASCLLDAMHAWQRGPLWYGFRQLTVPPLFTGGCVFLWLTHITSCPSQQYFFLLPLPCVLMCYNDTIV
jgi:hypothetical protein